MLAFLNHILGEKASSNSVIRIASQEQSENFILLFTFMCISIHSSVSCTKYIWTSTNGHIPSTATFFWADGLYSHSYFNLSIVANLSTTASQLPK